MTDRKLLTVPLVEYIFEVRWGAAEGGKLHEEFELSLGRLFEKLRPQYPEIQRVQSLPKEFYDALPPLRNVPFIRFRSLAGQPKESPYPLVQYGPGMAALNVDSVKYNWNEFASRAASLFNTLRDCHDLFESRIDAIVLRSIDMFEATDGELAEFIKQKTTLRIASGADELAELNEGVRLPEYSTTWRLRDQSVLRITAGSGMANERQGLVVNIAVESSRAVLAAKKSIEALLTYQHKIAGDSFFALLDKGFENELRNGKG